MVLCYNNPGKLRPQARDMLAQASEEGQWFSNLSMELNYLKSLLKHSVLGHTPTVAISESLESGPKMCISNKSPGGADAAGPRTTL